jgi:RNA-directed DNA polymerase
VEDLYARVRSRPVLHRAWAVVRASGLASISAETNLKTKRFEENSINNLARIARHLRNKTFVFDGETGIAPPKPKGKSGRRPIVIAPIENRIVRRAILDVLQGYGDHVSDPRRYWPGIPAVRQVMETHTSVGGIRSRGVPHGLSLTDSAVRNGNYWFARSDIKNFFTRIPLGDVIEFVSNAVADPDFIRLFAAALATNLVNKRELEERRLFKLFPHDGIGVAQGSALSALAGNVVLKRFDEKMNGRGIVCVRYIDDFIILGQSQKKVRMAYSSARSILSEMGMDAYDLNDEKAKWSRKVDTGNIHDGTDVLGYRISGYSRQPCAAARKAFLQKLDAIVTNAKREMRAAASGQPHSHLSLYHHSMVTLNNVVWGWSQSFGHTTAAQVFESLDREIGRRIKEMQDEARRLIGRSSTEEGRRVLGIHLLRDTKFKELPKIPNASNLQARSSAL